MVKKFKSSALLIALLLGILMSGLVVGVSTVVSEHVKLAEQSREGRLAYRSALSGIEEGLLSVKYAKSSGKLPDLYGEGQYRDLTGGDSSVQPSEMSYDMIIDAPFSSTYTDSQSYRDLGQWPDVTERSELKKINVDDTFDIDLTQLINEKNLKELEIYFSGPYTSEDDAVTSNFTALNWVLLDLKKNKTVGTERQYIASYTNESPTRAMVKISASDIANCTKNDNECHLRIRPQAATRIGRTQATRRFSGLGSSSVSKSVYLAIKAIDKDNKYIIGDSSEENGVITVTSVGRAGQAVRRLSAKVDASSGAYLGLFDFGIYCGTNCTNLSTDQP